MRRSIACIMVIIMAFSLASCGKVKAEMYCYNCGEGIGKSDSFCSACGASMKEFGDEQSEIEAITDSEKTKTEPETTTTTTTTTIHKHSYNKKVFAPTCTKKGYTVYTCGCGNSYNDDFVNAKHSYSKYVCTSCGAIDKKHAYEYLIEWVKAHGERRRGEVFVSPVGGDGAHEVVYNETYDYLYIRIKQRDSLLLLDLSDPNKNFEYLYEYKNYSASGRVNAKTYTKDTKLSCDEYSGYSGDKDTILRMATLHIQIGITIVNILDTLYESGVTYQDLGFESYVE